MATENVPARIKLREKPFDTKKMLDLFFGDKTIKKIWEENYHADDGSLLCVDSNMLIFDDGETAHYCNFQVEGPVNYQAAVVVREEYYRDTFGVGKELEDFPSQNAEERASELISKLEIANLGDPDIYAFSLDTYEKLNETDKLGFALNKKYQLTKDNEVYVLRYPQVFFGIELAEIRTSVKNSTKTLFRG